MLCQYTPFPEFRFTISTVFPERQAATNLKFTGPGRPTRAFFLLDACHQFGVFLPDTNLRWVSRSGHIFDSAS